MKNALKKKKIQQNSAKYVAINLAHYAVQNICLILNYITFGINYISYIT